LSYTYKISQLEQNATLLWSETVDASVDRNVVSILKILSTLRKPTRIIIIWWYILIHFDQGFNKLTMGWKRLLNWTELGSGTGWFWLLLWAKNCVAYFCGQKNSVAYSYAQKKQCCLLKWGKNSVAYLYRQKI